MDYAQVVTRPNPAKNAHERRAAVDADFDRFWAVYPLRRSKNEARQAWAAAVAAAGSPETVIAGAVRYRDDPNRPSPMKALRWLQGESWTDDPFPAARSPNGRESATDRDAIAMATIAKMRARPLDVIDVPELTEGIQS